MHSSEMLRQIGEMRFPGHDEQKPVCLMEICGTHTMSIAKAGLRQLLPPTVRLVSGPGCPVCVTPADALETAMELAMLPGVTVFTYGDLMRVPGLKRGDSLARRKALGADVRMVYSIMDAVEAAEQMPDRKVVFLGVGFETTAPGTAAGILTAAARELKNFSVLSMMKYTKPAVEALLQDEDSRIDGLICPGHVAAITGAQFFRFLPDAYGLPAVISGFEGSDVITAVYHLCEMLASGKPDCINDYSRLVREAGNPAALQMMDRVFEPVESRWRGLGMIPASGMKIREEFSRWDAARCFGLEMNHMQGAEQPGCCCGEVLKGRMHPSQCPLFGRICVPGDPVGPCMVSGEGACAAAIKYREVQPWTRS